MGITRNARPIEIPYAKGSRCVNSNISARKGISIMAVVRRREAAIAP